MKFRYAPTPSGYLHQGNLCNFLLTWLLARASGSPILLRIDDLNRERLRPAYLDSIFYTLDRFQLDYDEGPSGPDDFEKKWSQRHRTDLYEESLEKLIATGRVYACSCSRSQTQAGDTCRCKKANYPLHLPGTAWKWRVLQEDTFVFTDALLGLVRLRDEEKADFSVRKKDGMASYQVASLVDDHHFEITHLVRGIDLAASTAMQVQLDIHGLSVNFYRSTFFHHPLLNDKKGEKLSKSAGNSLKDKHSADLNLEDALQTIAQWFGLNYMQHVSTKENFLHVHGDFLRKMTLNNPTV
jgi:glutamyl/glutaminyl-tRNA synthetase